MNDNNNSMSPLVAEIVAAYVANNKIDAKQLPELINRVHQSFVTLKNSTERAPTAASSQKSISTVTISDSVQDDFLICLEDGKRMKMLKRYLRRVYKLTPEQYRQRWGLPEDYPMIAPNYSKKRSSMAKELGLGIKLQNGKNSIHG